MTTNRLFERKIAMKTNLMAVVLLALACGANSATADLMPVVSDNFNSYANGSIVGQGNWQEDKNGNNFVVQDATVFEGTKALYNNTSTDSVIGKQGDLLTDGRQIIYVRTKDRDSWDPGIGDGSAQIRISKSLWGAGNQPWLAVTFRKDGNVTFYNGSYTDFATYDDNAWTALAIEWRSDATARYQINGGTWTDWEPFVTYGASFTGFENVGFDFYNPGGSGGVYFDALGANPIPEPAAIGLLAVGAIGLLRRRK